MKSCLIAGVLVSALLVPIAGAKPVFDDLRHTDSRIARRLVMASDQTERSGAPAPLTFTALDRLTVEGQTLRFQAALTNPLPRPAAVFLFAADLRNPLTLRIVTPGVSLRRDPAEPPMPAPAPPPVMRWEIPANSRVLFDAELDLARYDYHGAPEVEVEWHFGLTGHPEPRNGRLRVILPHRP